MREISVEESKLILLDIMDSIDAFCRKESINYSLAYGTLIGAVRHHGYIPWDDDIDIMMPRKDYDRFVSSFKSDLYRIDSPETDSSYYLQYARVSDIRTCSVDQHGNVSYLAIDVFPFDGVPCGSFARKLYMGRLNFLTRVWSSQVFTKNLKSGREFSFKKNCLIAASKLLGKMVGMDAISRHFVRFKHSIPFEQSECCALLSDPGIVFETSKMSEFVDAQFEGHTYRIPKDYDYQLSLIYGEYMTVPPVEARVNHGAHNYWR